MEIESFEREEYLLFSGFNDDGESIDIETCGELFRCRALSTPRSAMLPPDVDPARAGGEATRGVHDHPPRGEEEKKAFDYWRRSSLPALARR